MRVHRIAFLLALGCAAGPEALLNTLVPASRAESIGPQGLEEITVTAERRESNLQTTPVTVTAITADQMADMSISSTMDIAKSVPNLLLLPVSASPSTMQIALRGGVEQSGGLITSEPVVGIYVDDVYRGRLQGANLQLTDVERVEVLRGPQGTLYGRNTFSGAIKIVTRTPSPTNEWFNVGTHAASFNEVGVQGSIGRALSDSVGGSLAVLYRDQSNGWIYNRAQQREVGAERNLAVHGKLSWKEGPWSATLGLGYDKDDNDGYLPTAIRFDPFTVPTSFATHVTTDNIVPRDAGHPYITDSPQPSYGGTKTQSATVNIAREFDAFTLRSISGYVHVDDIFRWDLAAGQNPSPGVYLPAFDRASDATAKQFTQELQALGQALDKRLDWIFGLYFFKESADQTLTDDIPLFGLRNLAPTHLSTDTKSWAAFSQASWHFTPSTSATLGLRYTSDDKSFVGDVQSGFGNPIPRTRVSLSNTWTSFTPKLGLDHKFSDDLFGYLSVAKGTKAGGFNGLSILNPLVLSAMYAPQNVWTYEAGMKAEWLDRRLRTNVTYFYNDISGLQGTSAIGGGSFAQQNIGDATVQGVEAEVSAQPGPGLNLFANVGWMDGKYDTILATSQVAVAGARYMPNVPRWTAQSGFSFEHPIPLGLLRFGANASYLGDRWGEVTNAVLTKGATRYDGFISLVSADRRWEATLQGQNLSNDVTYVNGFTASDNPAYVALRPRTWLLTVKYSAL